MSMPENKISISLNQKGNRNVNEWAEWLQVKGTKKLTKAALVWIEKETKIVPGEMGARMHSLL